MTAVVEIAGQQFVVSPSLKLNVPHLVGNPGDKLTFDKILLTHADDAVTVSPSGGGNVTATILEHGKGRKVLVFHKKKRKGYQKLNGHRPLYTRIQIDSVL